LAEAYKNAGGEDLGAAEDGAKEIALPPEVVVHRREQSLPSVFAESLAKQLAEGQAMGSQVHWGNDGFCVDVAVAHPRRPGDVTIGVLCDSNRYLQAPDPVEWDLFRMMVHESQGWQLRRVWTPQFFRDSVAEEAGIVEAVRTFLANEKPADALGVIPAVEEDASEKGDA
jgi:hypothetical protein